MRFLVVLFSLFIGLLISYPARADGSSGFLPCGDASDYPSLAGSQCLTAMAPLRPEAAAPGESIELFVRKFPVADPAQRRGEIWLVAGGPGEPGASFYSLLDVFRRAFPHHDLVIPDHRGTGYSTKLCPAQEDPGSSAGISLADDEWGPCIGSLHADSARAHAFTITNAAHDLSGLIKRHRGSGELLVYAVSYGTQLALRMMQVAPPALGGLILDGLVPPEGAVQWELSHRTAVVDRVGRATLGRQEERVYRRLLARTDAPWENTLPGGDLRRFMGSLLNFPELRERIPMLVRTISRGDSRLLERTKMDLTATFASMGRLPQSPPSLPLVILISGSENNSRRDLSAKIVQAEAANALFTSSIPGFLVNSSLPHYARDKWFGHVPPRLPRTLVIHGTLDPNTEYEGALAHAELLKAAGKVTFVTVEKGAHLLPLVSPRCFIATVSQFVLRRVVRTRCSAGTGR